MLCHGAGDRFPAPFLIRAVRFLLLLAGTACGRSDRAPVAPPHATLSPVLRELLRSDAGTATRHRVLVDLTAQVDLARLRDSLQHSGADRLARRRAVLEALQQVAQESQRRLDPLLRRLQRHGVRG